MAERRPPGFNVDLGFYDSDEVLSIPRKLRAAAVGVWTLAGSFSANRLSDGRVPAEALRNLGCTPAIRAALMATTKADGTPSPLWLEADAGAIQFTRWPKWQRTSAEVKAYREGEAERKRKAREAKKGTTTSKDDETSGRTSGGTPQNVQPEGGDPKPETKPETELSTYVPESATDPYGRGIAATPAADLVRRTIPRNTPAPTQTGLRHAASELLNTGTPADVVEEALRDWAGKTGIGPGVLASLASDVFKRRNGHTNGKPSKLRSIAELAAEERANEQLEPATVRRELR